VCVCVCVCICVCVCACACACVFVLGGSRVYPLHQLHALVEPPSDRANLQKCGRGGGQSATLLQCFRRNTVPPVFSLLSEFEIKPFQPRRRHSHILVQMLLKGTMKKEKLVSLVDNIQHKWTVPAAVGFRVSVYFSKIELTIFAMTCS
jgi:hypothetical protein